MRSCGDLNNSTLILIWIFLQYKLHIVCMAKRTSQTCFFALEPSTRQFAFLFLLCIESVLFLPQFRLLLLLLLCGKWDTKTRLDQHRFDWLGKRCEFFELFLCAKSKNPFALYKWSLTIIRLSHSARPVSGLMTQMCNVQNIQCSAFIFAPVQSLLYNSIPACLGRIHNSTQPKQQNSIHSYIEMHACSSFYNMLEFDFIHVGFVLLHSKVDLYNNTTHS